MNACYCDYDSMPEFHNEKYVIAKKSHRCCECKRQINIGEEYQYVVGKWDGIFGTYKTCEKCTNLRSSIAVVGCPYYGGLYEEYWEYLVSIMPTMELVKKQYDKVRG